MNKRNYVKVSLRIRLVINVFWRLHGCTTCDRTLFWSITMKTSRCNGARLDWGNINFANRNEQRFTTYVDPCKISCLIQCQTKFCGRPVRFISRAIPICEVVDCHHGGAVVDCNLIPSIRVSANATSSRRPDTIGSTRHYKYKQYNTIH